MALQHVLTPLLNPIQTGLFLAGPGLGGGGGGGLIPNK